MRTEIKNQKPETQELGTSNQKLETKYQTLKHEPCSKLDTTSGAGCVKNSEASADRPDIAAGRKAREIRTHRTEVCSVEGVEEIEL